MFMTVEEAIELLKMLPPKSILVNFDYNDDTYYPTSIDPEQVKIVKARRHYELYHPPYSGHVGKEVIEAVCLNN